MCIVSYGEKKIGRGWEREYERDRVVQGVWCERDVLMITNCIFYEFLLFNQFIHDQIVSSCSIE